ncbi:uncharacterized protein MONOS_11832 [Monocercomonoides exilis]|uniref:uncharacterized protein n=1 Tax=Monocercomonoides exilis TaxID=2049356 RepID=UPI00355A0D9F|nr:hypothetical protein MONOS_11832 [Monocercomonoides exilis]|eukprot:MONOS_11832.1-p1 / transcript=MONOS_11832.1 / gene=MONOS_11832 / organism=Monocercomonoides_exilis_PA203 / gene_product=unspecified product / transcript_product=unspecified product / location=Mono_scaffold00616:26954-27289(+) / protein_length=94 / sequence_SO=supercontig / SO=protein_coding / is_pseudo=false
MREEDDGGEGEVGGGVKKCLIETMEKITFRSLIDDVLRLEGHSFGAEVGALCVRVECLKGREGKTELMKCGFEEVRTRGCGIVVADESEAGVE